MFIVEKISMNFLEFSPGILLGFTIRIDHTAYAGFSSGILWRFFFQKQEFHGGSFPRISPGISQEIFENLSGTFSKKMHKKFHKNPRYHHFLQKIWQKFLRKKIQDCFVNSGITPQLPLCITFKILQTISLTLTPGLCIPKIRESFRIYLKCFKEFFFFQELLQQFL